MENRAFRADNGFTREARRLADCLVAERLGARDVAALHRAALAAMVDGESAERAHGLLDAGEETLIAVLGCLADGYLAVHGSDPRRQRSDGATVRASSPRPRTSSAQDPDAAVMLHLVVVGQSARTRGLERALHEIARRRHPAETYVKVSDLNEHPELFSELQVLATPVVIRELPGPARRLVGSTHDVERIISGLELDVPASRRSASPSTPAVALVRSGAGSLTAEAG